MIRNYWLVALRNLRHERTYAIINVTGLAIGLAICLLVMAYIVDEWSFDNFHAGRDQTYRIVQVIPESDPPFRSGTPFPVRPMLIDNVPDIETVVQVVAGEEAIVSAGGRNFRERITFADPEFFQLFSFRLLRGEPENALANPTSIVLTKSSAERIFGSTDVIGKELALAISGQKNTYVVSAVTEDTPANSSIEYGAVLLTSEISKYYDYKLGWNLTWAETYVRLRAGVDVHKVTADIVAAAQIAPKAAGSEEKWIYDLQPITSMHLDPSVDGATRTASPVNSYLLGGIGLIVLVLACINFTTLAIGRSQRRIREIGVRKVMGATEVQLYGQLLSEAAIISLLSLVVAFVLAELALPIFNSLSGKTLSSVIATNGVWSLGLVALVLLTALLAGGYPAFVLTRTSTVSSVRGHANLLSGGTLTRTLVGLQFFLSAALIVVALTMSRQLEFMRTAPVGFGKEQLVLLQLRGASGDEKMSIIERLRNTLHESDGVLSVCASGTSFNGGGMRNGLKVGPDSVDFMVFLNPVDYEYLSTMQVELTRGTGFRSGVSKSLDQFIVNETFTKALGWDNPIGQAVPGIDGSEIIGEVRDYHIRSLVNKIEPIALVQVEAGSSWAGMVRFAFLRLSTDNIPATMKRISDAWRQIAPNLPFDYEFMDEHIAAQYRSYQRWATIMQQAALLAVVVACFGVFGLTALAITRRRKELGIRKVLGARSGQLVTLLNREFVVLAVVGNLIAWPIAYYGVNRWLQGFAYRTPLSLWPFALGIVLLLGIVIVTVSVQTVRASFSNPVEAIRCE